MQGRLSQKNNSPLQSFPFNTWEDEFSRAKKIGFNKIEWLVDKEFDYKNPLFSEKGRDKILGLSNTHQIKVETLCAHFLIYGSILGDTKDSDQIKKYFFEVIEQAINIGINFISIPLMGKMSLRYKEVSQKIENLLKEINQQFEIDILLESDISNIKTFIFIKKLESKKIGMLYDLGNATKFNFSFKDDFPLIKESVKEIHIKDFSLALNKSVRLGEGDTNFEETFHIINEHNWKGTMLLETPIFDDWQKEAQKNYIHTTKYLKKFLY